MQHTPENEPTSPERPAASAAKPETGEIAAVAEETKGKLHGKDHAGTHKDMHEHEHLGVEKDALWNQEEVAYRHASRLSSEPLEQVYSPGELAEAFSEETEIFIGCMDERVQIAGMKKIGVGGSCVLLSEEQLTGFADRLKKAGKRVKFVTSHDGCGACDLFCKEANAKRKTEGKPALESKSVAEETARNVTKKLGIQGEPKAVGFKDMEGHAKIHHARGVVIDCSGRFNPAALRKGEAKKFPASFELTASAYPDTAQLEKEFSVALAIALGDHGMGAKRFAGSPILVTLVEDPRNPKLTAEVKTMVERVAKDRGVKLVAIVAPK